MDSVHTVPKRWTIKIPTKSEVPWQTVSDVSALDIWNKVIISGNKIELLRQANNNPSKRSVCGKFFKL